MALPFAATCGEELGTNVSSLVTLYALERHDHIQLAIHTSLRITAALYLAEKSAAGCTAMSYLPFIYHIYDILGAAHVVKGSGAHLAWDVDYWELNP